MKTLSCSLLITLAMLGLAACTQTGSVAPTPLPPTAAPSLQPTAPLAQPLPAIIVTPGYPLPQELITGEADIIAPLIEGAALLMTRTQPAQPVLELSGDLPTPCYSLRYKVVPPDAAGLIKVSLAVLPPAPGTNCTDVVSTIKQQVPLGNLPSGLYTVLVNGQKVGSLQVP